MFAGIVLHTFNVSSMLHGAQRPDGNVRSIPVGPSDEKEVRSLAGIFFRLLVSFVDTREASRNPSCPPINATRRTRTGTSSAMR